MNRMRWILLASLLAGQAWAAGPDDEEVAVQVVSYRWSDASYTPWDAEAFRAMASKRIDPGQLDTDLLSAAIFAETNAVRQHEGLPALAFCPACRVAAQRYSDDMVRLRFFDANHGHPDPAQATPKDRMTRAGLRNAFGWGENIAEAFGLVYRSGDPYIPPERPGESFRDQAGKPIPAHTYASFAAAVVDQWMHSPHHRANILNADWTHLGAACAAYREDGFPRLTCTQDFARIRG